MITRETLTFVGDIHTISLLNSLMPDRDSSIWSGGHIVSTNTMDTMDHNHVAARDWPRLGPKEVRVLQSGP